MAITVNTAGLMSSSGFDVQGLVDQMITAMQAPEQAWKDQQTTLNAQSAALQTLSSDLNSLNTSVDGLTSVLGSFAQRTATSSDDSLVSASASTAAAIGQHAVVVTSLATKAGYYSEDSNIATGDTAISGGSMTIKIGNTSQQIMIGNSDTGTLNKIASKINGLAMGVTASVITDSTGAKLALVSNNTGKANDITLTTTSDSALSFTKSSAGNDAVASVDGIPISSANNTLSNVIAGLTIALKGQMPGVPVTITVAADTARVAQAITSFVNNYNTLIEDINSQFMYDQTSGVAGPLAGDASVRSVQEQLMQLVAGANVSSSATPTLRNLGIMMNDDGTLSIDNLGLTSALAANFSAVQTFFQDDSKGFATQLGTLMDSLNDSVRGPFVVDLQGIKNDQAILTNNITDFEDRLTLQRQSLVDKFSQVNALLQELPTTQNQIDAMLGSINSSSSKK